jgi:hypothetical protein
VTPGPGCHRPLPWRPAGAARRDRAAAERRGEDRAGQRAGGGPAGGAQAGAGAAAAAAAAAAAGAWANPQSAWRLLAANRKLGGAACHPSTHSPNRPPHRTRQTPRSSLRRRRPPPTRSSSASAARRRSWTRPWRRPAATRRPPPCCRCGGESARGGQRLPPLRRLPGRPAAPPHPPLPPFHPSPTPPPPPTPEPQPQSEVQNFQEECTRDLAVAEPVIAEAEAALNRCGRGARALDTRGLQGAWRPRHVSCWLHVPTPSSPRPAVQPRQGQPG